MNGAEVIRTALASTGPMLAMHLQGFTNAELFVRPTPGANHLAWQIGHLIVAERSLVLGQLPSAEMPSLPEGFAASYKSDAAKLDGPEGFETLAEYLALFSAMRAGSIAAITTLTDADLDRPTVGPLAGFAPTLGGVLLLVANHALLHCGQITVVRRLLGKPVLF
jgi:hypothetical protein